MVPIVSMVLDSTEHHWTTSFDQFMYVTINNKNVFKLFLLKNVQYSFVCYYERTAKLIK